tara:strand:+ start:253 stop:474 length:222 start_codon:yes stop_codon:yes gene_type:complete
MRIIYNENRLYLSLTRDEQELIHCDYYNKQTKPLEIPMSYLNGLHKDVFDAMHKRYKELDERYRPEAYIVESS